MKTKNDKSVKRKPHEYSFTLLEVIIATGLLVAVVLQVAGGQGSLLEITDYSKKATEATWLAKRIMSEVEANYQNYEFKDLDYEEKDQTFVDYKDADSDYKYSLKIEEWKLPIIDFLTGGGGKSEEEKEHDKEEGKAVSALEGIPGLDAIVKQIFGDHMLKTAIVEVSWPEGARRNSVTISYVITNQKKLDEFLLTKANTWDQIRKKMDPNAAADKTPPPVNPQVDANGNPISNPSGTQAPGGNAGTGTLQPGPNGIPTP